MNESIVDDAVIFNDTLNPLLWDGNGDMRPEIRRALLTMAAEFREYLGIDDLDVIDITVSGSNAAYSYTKHSDIDLHLVVKVPESLSQLYRELFDAKKNLYNLMHNQTIKGYDVEFYVQDSTISVKSLGLYSVQNGSWESAPRRRKAEIDDLSVKAKVETYTDRIFEVLRLNDLDLAKRTWADVREMRQAGLERAGEFGSENVAYKVLRTRGLIKRLFDRVIELQDLALSVESLQG